MSYNEFHIWMVEINPSTRPVGPIKDESEAIEIFETYLGKRSKHPIRLNQFSCDADLPKRFPLGTHAAIEGALKGGYGVMKTLRELDLDGNEIVLENASSPLLR